MYQAQKSTYTGNNQLYDSGYVADYSPAANPMYIVETKKQIKTFSEPQCHRGCAPCTGCR